MQLLNQKPRRRVLTSNSTWRSAFSYATFVVGSGSSLLYLTSLLTTRQFFSALVIAWVFQTINCGWYMLSHFLAIQSAKASNLHRIHEREYVHLRKLVKIEAGSVISGVVGVIFNGALLLGKIPDELSFINLILFPVLLILVVIEAWETVRFHFF